MSVSELAPQTLSDMQIAQYRHDGFLILRGVFGEDEIAMLDAEAQRLVERQEL